MSRILVNWDDEYRPDTEAVITRYLQHGKPDELTIPFVHYRAINRWITYLERSIKEHNDGHTERT